MAGPWLYAISARAGLDFELKGNRSLAVSIKSYEKLLQSGELVEDAWWYISQNWSNIDIGDEVFIYTGDEDRGIIGYATVQEVKLRRGEWCILMNFDLQRCRALFANPIPAKTVRKWVPYPRKNTTNLSRHKSQIHRLMP